MHQIVTQRPFFSGKTEKKGKPEASAAANLIQPLSLGCAEPAPLEGEPWVRALPLGLLWEGSLWI